MATIRAELIKNTNKIRVRNLTDYSSYPNARTILSITDPNGNPISINTDFDSPDMTVGDAVSDEFSLNLVSGAIPEGTYSIAYSVDYDNDDVADDTGTLTFEYDATDLISMSIEISYSLADATIESEDTTTYDARVTLNTRTHTLTYPASRGSTSSSDVDNNTTIALTELYTGEYEAEITSGILIEVSSTYWIYDEISDTQTSTVWSSSGIEDLESSIEELRSRYESSLSTDNGTATQLLETAISRVNINWTLYKINRDAGDRDGASTYLNNIADILSAEDVSIYEPEDASVPVARTYPGYATEWIIKDGEDPVDATDGRNGDFALRVDNNKVFRKTSGTWGSSIATLGANAIIQYSANGTSGWTTTYANGLNYIRFSGDGGSTWENASKFIDGYRYVAYASAADGSDFICEDDPTFIFDPSLEYRAEKKFDESHNGDLEASDFSGLFTKFKDRGIIAYCTTPSISIPADADGNNVAFPITNPEIKIVDGDTDVTSLWTITINTNTNVIASVVNDNEIDITAMSSDQGSILVDCNRSGYDTLQVLIGVHKTKAGQAVVDRTSSDTKSIEYTNDYGKIGNSKSLVVLYNSDICNLTHDLIAFWNADEQEIQTYKFGTSGLLTRNTFYQIGNGLSIATATNCRIASLTSTRIALIDYDNAELSAYDWDGSDWTLVSNKLSVTLSLTDILDITSLSSTRVAILSKYDLSTYDLASSTWSKTGNTLDVTTEGIAFSVDNSGRIAGLSTTDVVLFCQGVTPTSDDQSIVSFTFDGTDWSIRADTYSSESIVTRQHDISYIGEDSNGTKYVVTASVGYSSNYLLLWILTDNSSEWELIDSYSLNTSEENGIYISSMFYNLTPDDFCIAVASVENATLDCLRPSKTNRLILNYKGVRPEHLSDDITDGVTTQLNENGEIEVKDAGVDTQHISDLAVTGGKLNFGSIKSNIFLNSEPTLSPGAYPVSLGFLDVDRIAAIYTNGSSEYVLACLEYSNGELAVVGTPRLIADVGMRIANLKKNRIVTLSPGSVGDKEIQVYDFDGTVFSIVGSPGVLALGYVHNIVSLSDTSVAVLGTEIIDGSPSNLILQKWNFNGSTWVQDGTDYVVDSSIYLSMALYGLDKSDDNTVFVHCYMTDKFYKCSFSGDWSTDFSATLSTSGDTEIVAISTNEFIIFADGNNKGWNYKIYRDELYLLGEITFPTVTGTGLSMVKMPDGMIIACLGATNGFKTYYYSKGGLYFE